MQQLIGAANHFGIQLNSVQLEQFRLYRDELITWNRSLNLTAINTPEDIELKHFADSLSVLPALGKEAFEGSPEVIDIGTGAGFPGIPLKIAFPCIRLTLLDSTQKKLRFIEHITTRLGLENASVVTGRAEEIAHDPSHRSCYQLVLSRAVAKLPALAELCLPYCSVNGLLATYKKGDISQEVASCQNAVEMLGGKIKGLSEVTFPGLADGRFIVIMEKINPTPLKYPRRPGIPLKNPL